MDIFCFFFFFFKQKTAYEIGVRLVGSEMCIRDRYQTYRSRSKIVSILHRHNVKNSPMRSIMLHSPGTPVRVLLVPEGASKTRISDGSCLLYTSDAADDLLCVDLGVRRII